jgi:hypothetical protein
VTEGAREQRRRGVGGRSTYAVSLIAWSSWFLYVALAAVGVVFAFLNHPTGPTTGLSPALGHLAALIAFLAFPTVGALIAARQPKNPIGWIFCAQGLTFALLAFCDGYARYTIDHPGALPGGVVMAWLSTLLWLPTFALGITLLLLFFPTGRLLSRRWRVWVAFAVVATAINDMGNALRPGPLFGDFSSYVNPFGIPGTWNLMDRLEGMGFFLLLVPLAASGVSLVVRFRRSRGTERQQLKWLLYDAVFVGLMVPPFVLVENSTLITAVGVIAYASSPVVTGIAILRYRLYDIDVVINRTLVYGALTALLAAGYFATIVALQGIGNLVVQFPFRAVFGQESTLATIAATLAIAALFNPLRRRIQGFVDRRFYRRKYDAAKTLEGFSMKLRDETDLEALSDDLVGVVTETMQPTHVSLWLRPDTAPQRQRPS